MGKRILGVLISILALMIIGALLIGSLVYVFTDRDVYPGDYGGRWGVLLALSFVAALVLPFSISLAIGDK